MQQIRAVKADDYNQIESIYKQFFADQFSFPDFMKNYLAAFVVEDEGQIIVAGGVRTIAEAVMVTNKNIEIRQRRKALFSMLQAFGHLAKMDDYDQLHAFVQDDNWKRHLIHIGFNPTKGEALVLNLT